MTPSEQLHEQAEELAVDYRIERACFQYLSKLGYSLWANWEIQREERRRLASDWWASHNTALIDQMSTRDLAAVWSLSRQRLIRAWWHGLVTRIRFGGI